MRSVELFAGCGGLAFGLAEAGFEHVMVIENDAHASATLEKNKAQRVRHFSGWPIRAEDVRAVRYSDILGPVDLVAGGPPCQPFSIGGRHKGPSDRRNMWPEALRAVRELQPKAFLFENVRGLLRPGFGKYLDFLRLQLRWPSIEDPAGNWRDHCRALKAHEQRGAAPRYHVVIQGINAADYGAPQKRHRAIILGIRSDVSDEVRFPKPTHSREALVWNQRVTSTYWERHEISVKARSAVTKSDAALLERLRELGVQPTEHAWATVRDAIGDLPAPSLSGKTKASDAPSNHRLHPGARVYARHTGSTWDEPAKALKAGDHGVPGGENVLVGRRGAVRYFTIREMARLQGMPDDFDIDGRWKNPIKQLGNAVPVHVGRIFGAVLREALRKCTS